MNITQYKQLVADAKTGTKEGAVSKPSNPFFFPMPVTKDITQPAFLTAGIAFSVNDGGNNHNVLVAVDGSDGVYVFCGSGYLSGTKDENRVNEIDPAPSPTVMDSMKEAFGMSGVDDSCSFWTNNVLKGDEVIEPCGHINAVLSAYGESLAEDAKRFYNQNINPFSGENVKSEHDKFLEHYAFKKPVLVVGDKGSGKTFALSKFVSSYNSNFIAGSEAVEAIDLLGHLVRFDDGSGNEKMIWKDGALTSAMRKASNGEKSVLFIDEVLRIPGPHLSVLVGALTPNHQGECVLRTGRIIDVVDGVAQEEEIRAPQEFFWTVASTNVGADYGVDSMESALKDRFRILRKDTDQDMVIDVLRAKCTQKDMSEKTADKMLMFYNKMSAAFKSKLLAYDVNLRHICEIIDFAKNENDIPNEIKRSQLAWVGENIGSGSGEPIQDHVDEIDFLIEQIF